MRMINVNELFQEQSKGAISFIRLAQDILMLMKSDHPIEVNVVLDSLHESLEEIKLEIDTLRIFNEL